MMLNKKIAIVTDATEVGSPAQQLIDRFLIGFTRDGVFQNGRPDLVSVWSDKPDAPFIQQRVKSHNLRLVPSSHGLRDVEAALIVHSRPVFSTVFETIGRRLLPVFIYPLSVPRKSDSEPIGLHGTAEKLPCYGTVFSALQQLPPLNLPKSARIYEALIVAQGPALDAESKAIEAIFSIIDQQPGGLRSIQTVRSVHGEEVWQNISPRSPLLAAALSRTDNALGHTDLDGRTEDIVGLGLVRKMAPNPRAVLIEHSNKARTTVLILNGVVKDILAAVRTEGGIFSRGRIYSTQLFQSPSPQQEHFSRLAAIIADFFQTGKRPWGIQRELMRAEIMSSLA